MTYVVGFPRIGEQRELKKALEAYWAGNASKEELKNVASDLRKRHWIYQKNAGINLISVNDFSFYDNMIDAMVMLNATPAKYDDIKDCMDKYFAMARGDDNHKAMEMTKWFNTNYHYIVPELDEEMDFKASIEKIKIEYNEAKELGIKKFVDKLIIRSQQQARYDAVCTPHFALGFDRYTHFTSPIRRYSDLTLHRLLKSIIKKDKKQMEYILRNIESKLTNINDCIGCN